MSSWSAALETERCGLGIFGRRRWLGPVRSGRASWGVRGLPLSAARFSIYLSLSIANGPAKKWVAILLPNAALRGRLKPFLDWML